MTRTLCLPSDEFTQRVVRTHLDPDGGTLYWIERARYLCIDPIKEIVSFEDFKSVFGFRDRSEQQRFEAATRFRNLEDFVPRSVRNKSKYIWASQTGGTTGAPKHGTWGSDYFASIYAFSNEMLDLHGVPRDVNWMFIGPTGPHTTGRWIINLAESRGGLCFSIDLDPRIVKIFGEERMFDAYDRYIQHIWDQVVDIVRYQDVGVLFATSRLLEMMPEKVDLKLFANLKGIVHAGTTLTRDTNRILQQELFPGVPQVGVYGTSTTSVSFQKPPGPEDDFRVIYIPSSPFVTLEIVDDNGNKVPPGSEGHVATYRLTQDSLIPGFWERDRAIRVEPYGKHAGDFAWSWIEGPYSPEFTTGKKVEGVY